MEKAKIIDPTILTFGAMPPWFSQKSEVCERDVAHVRHQWHDYTTSLGEGEGVQIVRVRM